MYRLTRRKARKCWSHRRKQAARLREDQRSSLLSYSSSPASIRHDANAILMGNGRTSLLVMGGA